MDIALDFDKVLHSYSGYEEELGQPMPGAVQSVQQLFRDGHSCYVQTARKDIAKVSGWLKEFGFPKMEVSNEKKPAHVYVDDRAYRFNAWSPQTIREIEGLVDKGEEQFTGYNKNYFASARKNETAVSSKIEHTNYGGEE